MEPVFACEPFTLYFQQWMKGRDPLTGEEKLWTDIRFAKAQYDGEIAYLDTVLGALFARLRDSGAEEETLVVITADHGEELDEHALWFDHHGLYETNLWVPLILCAPGHLPKGQRRGGMVTLLDIAPTILDALGMGELAEKEGMEGRSLLPLVLTESDEGTVKSLYLTECAWMKKRGWRTPEWKLIVETGETPAVYGKPEVELYHLPSDPNEQCNLAEERADVVARLREEMEAWIQRRVEETGQQDPFDYQTITFRRIGRLETAVPADQRLDERKEV
jgi:arylsulfatase A-like enzyme